MKSLSDMLFKDDQLDEAIEYLLPSTIPSFMTDVIKKYYLTIANSTGNKNLLIDTANRLKVCTTFDSTYANFILNILGLADETAFFVETDRNAILRYYTIMKAEKKEAVDSINIEEALSNSGSKQLWLFISKTKNDKLFTYLAEYFVSTTRFVASDRSIYVQLLPNKDYVILDKLCRALISYL